MSSHRPKEWILAVLSRFDKLLESSVTQNSPLPSQLDEHKACLIHTSQTNCSIILGGLANSLKKLFSIRIYGERQEFNLYDAQIIVLDVLEKCIRTNDSSLPEDSSLMRLLLPEICQLLHQPSNDKPVLTQLQASASRVLYCISQNNFNVVFSRISTRIHDFEHMPMSTDDLADLSDLGLIQHIFIDLVRITRILEEVVQRFRNLRKPVQMALTGSLDKALWNWLSSCPTELNILYKTEPDAVSSSSNQTGGQDISPSVTAEQRRTKSLASVAEKLFDILDAFTEGSKKKAALFWPLQTTLLILCPDILGEIVSGNENLRTGKHDLFVQLKKVVVGRHVLESCAGSYIRILKAATCIKPENNHQSVLHKLVKGFLPDLQTYLFENGSKYFLKTLDQEALIECFVSSFRLYPEKINLAKLCASSSSSIHHKMVLVQSLHCICTQPCLEWWPRIELLYDHGSDIRKIFHNCIEKHQLQLSNSPRASQSLRERMERMNVGLKRVQDEAPTNKDLLHVIIQLIQGDPSILLKDLGSNSQQDYTTVKNFFVALASLFTVHNSSNLQLSFESMDALLRLHDPQIISLWNSECPMFLLWDISSTILCNICETLLQHQMTTPSEVASHSIKWINQILACRIEFFIRNQDKNHFGQKADIVSQAQLKLEMTLLEHLWNSASEVVMSVLSCLQCLHEEYELRWASNNASTGRIHVENYVVYQELSTISVLKECETVQARVASVLRRIHKFPPACLKAWEDLRTKWEKRMVMSYKQGKEDTVGTRGGGDSPVSTKSPPQKSFLKQQDVMDWINMTRFLCALGGVCAKPMESILSPATSTPDRRVSNSSVPSSSVSSQTDYSSIEKTQFVPKNTVSVTRASRFLTHLLNLLGSYNSRTVDINNSIRDLLGSSLHPALYPTLFQQMKIFLKSNLLDSSSHMIMNQSNNLFVQYMIVILQKIFEQSSEQDAEYLSEESIECMILHIVRYVRHTGTSSFAVELRIAFCKMIGEMMSRKDHLFFLSEIQFRNKLVEHLTDWIMASPSQQVSLNKTTPRDLDEAAISAVGILLDKLPLHPDEGDGGDVPEAKSQLFLKYFTLFMKLLSDCTDELTKSERIDDNLMDAHQTVALRRALIVAMSNMLSANIEYGLVHAMSLAYHDDVQTRAAFLEVIIKILQQGTAGFKSLSDCVLAERFERLVELVTMMGDNGELPIANALANVVHTTYMDELARVFVTLFDAKHLLYQLLWNMFSKEVDEADTVQMLFRGNSLASKIMTFCFKVYGASYLHNLLEPLVAWSLSPEISSLQFHIDQKRIPPGVDIIQCRANLQRLTERFFSRIMTSTDRFPPQLKSVCHCLYQVVSQKFHESGTGAVASAIFLRFLNPAIATPFECGLCEKPPPPNLARAFKFMCKIMQNIANHVIFTKEEHMKPFNDFVKLRFDVCQQFFMQISTPECSNVENIVHSTSYINDANVAALHRLLWNDQEKIGKFLAKSRNAKAVGRRPFDKMVTLLAYLGPPEYTRPALETRITGQSITPCEFDELMQKRKVSDSKEYKMAKGLNIFYQFGRSKMGYPVFYYIARRYLRSDIREEILMFYILQALKPYTARKFDLVIDLTQVDSKNSLRNLPKWLVVYPPNIYKNLDTVYIYNPNTWLCDYVKYNRSTLNQFDGHESIKFIEELSELQKWIEIDHQKIPAATRGLDEDVTCYYNAIRSGSTKVNIKVGCKAVQITMAEKIKLLGHDMILNDIYYSNEIEAIESSDECLNGFVVSTGNKVLLFSHPEASKIIQDIRHIRARWELTRPVDDLSTHHKISAKDVPGTLLNMALLNLGCSHPMVRSCAYNLLCCLTSSFNLQLEGRLCQSDGLCIPANNTLFIVSISNTLSKNESHLTLEFVKECITGFRCLNDKLKTLCLEYMEPWLFNLPAFASADQTKRNKVKAIIGQLIELTIAEKNFYPSVQTKIWGNFAKLTAMIDLVLECFIEASSEGGLGSIKAEVMADSVVTLAANNMKLVSTEIINRLCHIVDKTSLRPTPTLEKHKHWDDIAILGRYLLMLSFNNNLDVVTHLPCLFHLVSLLLSTGPLSLRASVHGLVVNIIHSLLTCRQLEFEGETQRVLRLSLTEFCLPKFYQFFGIPNVQSAANTAFKSESFIHSIGRPSVSVLCRSDSTSSFDSTDPDDVIRLSYLDVVVDTLLEVMEACMKHLPVLDWLNQWQEMSEKFAFQYNPSLQPRALVVMGCISKRVTMRQIKQILGIMGRSLESNADPVLLEATIMCLTRLQLCLEASPDFHCMFFWLGICAMQLNEKKLYAAGLSLVEQNLHRLDEIGAFTLQTPPNILMKCQSVVERHFEQLQSAINIDFKSNFHYAFVTHLIKGFHHSDCLVVSRAIRVLDFFLELLSRYKVTHKFEVNPDSVPYLAALLRMCPEVRRHCIPRKKPESSSTDSHKSTSSTKISSGQHTPAAHSSNHSVTAIVEDVANHSDAPSSGSQSSRNLHSTIPEDAVVPAPVQRSSVTSMESRFSHEPKQRRIPKRPDNRECGTTPPKLRKIFDGAQDSDSSSSSGSHMTSSSLSSCRHKHPPDPANNALMDDEILDHKAQALLLTLLASQVNHFQSNCDVEVIFEYLAQASIAFPAVFPIVHNFLDRNINSILQHCEDTAILSHVQVVVQNALLCSENDQTHRQISFLQEIGFGGIWRFSGPFAKVPFLEHTSSFVKLIDLFTTSFLSDVSDLTPVQSKQSLNSALSATSADDIHDSASESDSPAMDEDDAIAEATSPPPQHDIEMSQPLGDAPKSGSFRNKGPKLTIKLPG